MVVSLDAQNSSFSLLKSNIHTKAHKMQIFTATLVEGTMKDQLVAEDLWHSLFSCSIFSLSTFFLLLPSAASTYISYIKDNEVDP